jgi:scyllo-inositol 2-dehydrogenase (NADP+)
MAADSPSPDRSSDVRVAIIGYGLAGSVFHAPLVTATPGLHVAAIVTTNAERRARAQRAHPGAALLSSADEIWAAPDAFDVAVIATPNETHAPFAACALEAGLATVIDKPMAATVDDARRLIDVSQRTGSMLTVFQNRRWDGDFLTLRRLLQSGVLGTITRFESRFERYRLQVREGSWKEQPGLAAAGGLLYDIGSHLIDQAVVLFGRPMGVYAEMDRRRPHAAVDDDTFVALHFPDGVRAHLWMSLVARQPGPRLRLSGLQGTYEKAGLDPQEEALRTGKRPGDPGWGSEPRERWGTLATTVNGLLVHGSVEPVAGSYEAFYAALHRALLQDEPPPVDPEDVLDTLRIIAAARESARTGTVIPFSV